MKPILPRHPVEFDDNESADEHWVSPDWNRVPASIAKPRRLTRKELEERVAELEREVKDLRTELLTRPPRKMPPMMSDTHQMDSQGEAAPLSSLHKRLLKRA